MSFAELMRHAKDIAEKAVRMDESDAAQNRALETGGPSLSVDRVDFRQKYAFVEPLFEPFSLLPDPAKYDPMLAELLAAMHGVSTGGMTTDPITKEPVMANIDLDKMTTAGGFLEGWTGSAAMAFKENFLDTFKTVANNQFILIATMRGAIAAHKEVWSRARTDIDKIAHDTVDALDHAGDPCTKNQWSFTFSVVSAIGSITGVGFAILTAAKVASIAISAIGAGASAGSATIAGITASGDSAEVVVNSMKQAIDQLTRHIRESEAAIEKTVHDIIGAVNSHRELLVAVRPRLAGMPDRELIGDRGMGRPG